MDRNHVLGRDAVRPLTLPEGRRVDFPLGKYCTMDLGVAPEAWLHSNAASMNPSQHKSILILLLLQGSTFCPSILALLQDHPRQPGALVVTLMEQREGPLPR